MQRALDAIPRLGQRVVGAPLRIVPPEFADDPTLDLDAHVRVVAVPSPGDDRALLDLCGALAEQPLDRARPLWEFTIIDGLTGGRCAMLQKIHHTITDGVGGLKLSLAMVDFERDPEPEGAATSRRTRRHARHAALDGTRRRRRRRAAQHRRGAPHDRDRRPRRRPPERGARAGRRMPPGSLNSLQRQALVTDAARSDVMRDRSLRRHFEIFERSVRAAAAAPRPSWAAASTTPSSPVSRARSAATTSGPAASSTSSGSRCRSAPGNAATASTNSFVPRASSSRSSPRTTSARCSATCTNGCRRPRARPR